MKRFSQREWAFRCLARKMAKVSFESLVVGISFACGAYLVLLSLGVDACGK